MGPEPNGSGTCLVYSRLEPYCMEAGSNRLTRPVAGGTVEAGFLRGGETVHTNLTLNTETGEYEVIGFGTMYLTT